MSQIAELIKASRNGDLNAVKQLVESGVNINNKSDNGITPLYIATRENHKAIVDYLIANGANVNEENGNGVNKFTALGIAVTGRQLGIAKALVEAGANVNKKDGDNNSPLYSATTRGHVEMVKYLIASGANVNETNAAWGNNALGKASASKNLDIVKALVEAGANVNLKNIPGYTPLNNAIQHGNANVINYLLANGASIKESESYDKHTILHEACYIGDLQIVKILINAGLDINAKRADGKTPLDVAIFFKHPTVVTYLKNLLAPKEPVSTWKGFTRGTIEKFDTIFDLSGSPPPANNIAVCPVCLKYVERSEACMYMSHDCETLGGYYHKELYEKYKNSSGHIGWCTICGRICVGHNHYELRPASDPKAKAIITVHDPFSKDCRDANGGGGLPEKFSRFRRMREYALELQGQIGKMKEDDALNMLIEETWNAPLNPSHNVSTIMTNLKWNIPTEVFPPNVVSAQEPLANVNDPTKYQSPIVLIPGEAGYLGNDYAMDNESPVIIFKHKSASGADHIHPQISKGMLLDMLDGAGEKQGKCFDNTCKGLLWPKEIQLAFDDPKMAPTVTDKDKERLRKYKERFNAWHSPSTGGYRKSMKTVRQRRI